MEENVKSVEVLPAVAKKIADWIPELGGRSVAVTEAEVTKDNVPTLPIAIVGPVNQVFTHNGGEHMTVQETFAIEFWLEPARVKSAKGETPFWSYYDYNEFRDKLFTCFAAWRGPNDATFQFISMDVESNFLATVLSFRLRATYDICADRDDWEGPAEITFKMCAPRSPDCLPEPEQEKDPCLQST